MSTEPVEESTLTLSRRMSTADVIRTKGWGAGTRLTGDEGRGPTVIEITAVGEKQILAKSVSGSGAPTGEGSWTLSNRDWTEVSPIKTSTERSNS